MLHLTMFVVISRVVSISSRRRAVSFLMSLMLGSAVSPLGSSSSRGLWRSSMLISRVGVISSSRERALVVARVYLRRDNEICSHIAGLTRRAGWGVLCAGPGSGQ